MSIGVMTPKWLDRLTCHMHVYRIRMFTLLRTNYIITALVMHFTVGSLYLKLTIAKKAVAPESEQATIQ